MLQLDETVGATCFYNRKVLYTINKFDDDDWLDAPPGAKPSTSSVQDICYSHSLWNFTGFVSTGTCPFSVTSQKYFFFIYVFMS